MKRIQIISALNLNYTNNKSMFSNLSNLLLISIKAQMSFWDLYIYIYIYIYIFELFNVLYLY